jgi:hypothetical protein
MYSTNSTIVEAVILSIVCGATLYVLSYVNPKKQVEEYYRVESPAGYVALELCTVLIVICFAINSRFLLTTTGNSLFGKK